MVLCVLCSEKKSFTTESTEVHGENINDNKIQNLKLCGSLSSLW